MHTLDICVQHHPGRAELIAPLLAALPTARVVADPNPNGVRSAWRTYRECLARPVETTHRLVIQDDVIVCRNFLPALDRIIEARPGNPVVLFVGGAPRAAVESMAHACSRGQTFADWPNDTWVAAPAVIWPTDVIPDVLAWVERQRYPAEFGADDEILGRAFRTLRIPVVATVPSLVEHPDEVDSIKRNNRARAGENPDRVAWCYADHIGVDPLDLDWR